MVVLLSVTKNAAKDTTFPVDAQLLRVLPRAGASLRNPDVNLPTLARMVKATIWKCVLRLTLMKLAKSR